MQQKEINTEQLILEASRRVFTRKGLDGARMQEIADEAGINKALLHYYFRNKETLFDAVFSDLCARFFSVVNELMISGDPVFDKIGRFIDNYLELLSENPFLPNFIINEINRNPDRILEIFNLRDLPKEVFFIQIKEEIRAGRIREIDPKHLFIHIIAMCVFPFIGKPIIRNLLFNNNEDEMNTFLAERKKEVYDFIINSIQHKP